jgi:type IV pilus assembly protein PilM
LGAAALLAIGALLPPIGHFHRLASAAEATMARVEATIAPLRIQAARNRAEAAKVEALRSDVALLDSLEQRRTRWLGLLSHLQAQLVRSEDVWLERLRTIPPAADAPVRLAISGRMLDRMNPEAKAGPETFRRLKVLLASLADSPSVFALEGERFDTGQPGILKFDFILVVNPSHPL